MTDGVDQVVAGVLRLPWHDARLLGVEMHLAGAGGKPAIGLLVDLPTQVNPKTTTWRRARVRILGVRRLEMLADLEAMWACDHAVLEVRCEPVGSGAGREYLLTLELCPPSGHLTLHAAGFEVTLDGEPRTGPTPTG